MSLVAELEKSGFIKQLYKKYHEGLEYWSGGMHGISHQTRTQICSLPPVENPPTLR